MSDSLVEPAVLSADWFYALVGADYEHGGLVTMTIDQVWSNQQYREVAAAVLEYVADELERGAESWLKIACVPGRRTSAHDSRINELRAVAVTFRAKAREVRGEV